MPSKSRLVSKAFSSSGVLSTIASENPTVDTGTTQIANVDALPTSGNDIGDQLFIEATNRLYIWNGSGWYNIALINTSPTWDSGGQPSGSYVLDADSPQDATVITLAASDPDGLPISYSYVTSGSMDSMATISQDSSVFTITPKTLAQLGEGIYTGSITFRASDGVNILPQISNFTLTFIVTIENSKHTIALFDVTNTSDNNDITDSSTNNHTITVNGDAQAGTFSPYRHGGYSTYFDGTDDYLNIAYDQTIADWSSTDYTIEAWVYYKSFNVGPAGTPLIIRHGVAGASTNYWSFGARSTGELQFYYWNGGAVSTCVSTATLDLNTWHHIVMSYNNTNNEITLYLDGVSVHTHTVVGTPNYSNGSTIIIGEIQGTDHNGYITDLRIVTSEVYSAAFTPSAARLTAITNTQLLTCHLPYIADGSTNNRAITINGNTSTRPFTPFNNLEYSSANHGGSVYFDGTGDYLSAGTTSTNFGTDDFTIEAWIYKTTDASNFLTNVPSGNDVNYFSIYTTTTQSQIQIRDSSGQAFAYGPAVAPNTWNHVAVTRSSGSVRVFVNGVSGTPVTITKTVTSRTTTIGAFLYTGFESYYTGYISDLRVIKGTALYTSDFTPPTTPLTAVTNTSLLVSGTDASIVDKSQRSILQLTGAVGTTASVKFAGTKSIDFSTISNDYYVTIPSANNGGPGFPDLFSGPCTIECWINPQHTQLVNGLSHKIIWQFTSGSSIFYLQQWHTDELRMTVRSGGSTFFNEETTVKVAHSTWYHVCYMCNPSTSAALYLDGVKVYPTAFLQNTYGTQVANMSTALLNTSSPDTQFTLGSSGPGTPWAGYVNDLRISNYNVYGSPATTSSFTPPTAPFEG